jgi:hypothetical protein
VLTFFLDFGPWIDTLLRQGADCAALGRLHLGKAGQLFVDQGLHPTHIFWVLTWVPSTEMMMTMTMRRRRRRRMAVEEMKMMMMMMRRRRRRRKSRPAVC